MRNTAVAHVMTFLEVVMMFLEVVMMFLEVLPRHSR